MQTKHESLAEAKKPQNGDTGTKAGSQHRQHEKRTGADTAENKIVDAVIEYLRSIDLSDILKILSYASSSYLAEMAKENDMEDEATVRTITSDMYQITKLMVFLSKLFENKDLLINKMK